MIFSFSFTCLVFFIYFWRMFSSTITSEQLDMYQEKALDYSQQNKQLRREIANERFRRTRDSESTKYPSL
jgi:hypothetical protein